MLKYAGLRLCGQYIFKIKSTTTNQFIYETKLY